MQDLTKITTPFGLLDDETKAALKEHKGPIEGYDCFGVWHYTPLPAFNLGKVYRAKPQPVRGEIVKYVDGDHLFSVTKMRDDTHRLTLPTIDGKLITGEYRNDEGDVIKLEVL